MAFPWPYAAAVCLRVALLLAPGYIHPDEFFQAQEVAAIRRHEFDVPTPWEFACNQPCRSAVLPLTAASLPYAIVESLGVGRGAMASRAMLLAPRIVMCLLSFVLDWAAFRLAPLCGTPPRLAVLCLATSWPMLLMQSRPFSNSFEAAILSSLLVLWLAPPRALPRAAIGLTGGALLCVGLFFRFTILFYSLPLLVTSLFSALRGRRHAATNWLARLPNTPPSLAHVSLGFLILFGGLVVLDSHFFAADPLCVGRIKTETNSTAPDILGAPLVLTPLNSLLYNLDVKNLAMHGLHPRATHLVVNLPLLYGPLALVALLSAAGTVISRLRAPATRSAGEMKGTAATVEWVLVGSCGLCGLLLLSLAPHQEPRFLLPLALPLSLLFSSPLLPSQTPATASGPHSAPATAGRFSSGRSPSTEEAAPPDRRGGTLSTATSKARARTGRARGSSPARSGPKDRSPVAASAEEKEGSRRASTGLGTADCEFVLTRAWLVWLAFNGSCLAFFGGLHQAGVSGALHWLSRRPPGEYTLIWTHTYMPPVASLLLAPWEQRRQVPRAAEHGQAAAVATRSRWDSVDLAGAPLDTVVARVAAAVKPGREVYVVAPASVRLGPLLERAGVGGWGRGALGAIDDALLEGEEQRRSKEEQRAAELAAHRKRRQDKSKKLLQSVARTMYEAEAEREVAEANPMLVCRLSHRLLLDPVQAADGHTYDRQAIADHIRAARRSGQRPRSPVDSEQALSHSELTPNLLVRKAVSDALTAAVQAKLDDEAAEDPAPASAPSRAPTEAPARTHLRAGDGGGKGRGFGGGCAVAARIRPHLSMEDPPNRGPGLSGLWDEMVLEIIRCRAKLV